MNDYLEFEAIIAVYGVTDTNGNNLTEQGAIGLFDQLNEQAQNKAQLPGMHGYRIVKVRMEGDRKRGAIYATFRHPSEPTNLTSARTNRAMRQLAASSDVLEGDLSNGLETLTPLEDDDVPDRPLDEGWVQPDDWS